MQFSAGRRRFRLKTATCCRREDFQYQIGTTAKEDADGREECSYHVEHDHLL